MQHNKKWSAIEDVEDADDAKDDRTDAELNIGERSFSLQEIVLFTYNFDINACT